MKFKEYFYIRIKKENFPDENIALDEFKSWLSELYDSGKPMMVYYMLATPIEVTIKLPSISTNNITSIINLNTSIEPHNMMITYNYKRSILD